MVVIQEDLLEGEIIILQNRVSLLEQDIAIKLLPDISVSLPSPSPSPSKELIFNIDT